MFYLFVRQWDECGEGSRAELHEFHDRANADAAFDNYRQVSDVTEIKLITGTTVRSYDPNVDESLPTSEEVLKVSKLDSVDDLENKENV